MKTIQRKRAARAWLSGGLLGVALAAPGAIAAPCAPCQPRAASRRAANPCAAKNPCAAREQVDPALVRRPAGTRLATGANLEEQGRQLFADPRLGTNGLACISCHQGNAAFAESFAKPYPHQVAMAKDKAGLSQVSLDEMVQLCLVVPMAGKPLAWDSRELAALSAYTARLQRDFRPAKAAAPNPCAAKNPCAARNPCAAKNPCAAR